MRFCFYFFFRYLSAFLLAGLSCFTSVQAASCPFYKVGAYDITQSKEQLVFISTAMVEIQDTQQESIDLASSEAEIAARAGLQKLNNYPKDGTKMSGVFDVNQCVAGLRVYATVKFTSSSHVSAKICASRCQTR